MTPESEDENIWNNEKPQKYHSTILHSLQNPSLRQILIGFFYSNPAPTCILWSCCHRSSFSQYFFSKFWNEDIKPRTSSSVLFFVESTRVRNSSTSFSLASIREIPSNRCDSTLFSSALAISRSFCVDWSALVSVAVVSAWRFSTEYRGSESDCASNVRVLGKWMQHSNTRRPTYEPPRAASSAFPSLVSSPPNPVPSHAA